ncbi:MAG TPA: hypothetical protein VM736_02305 [Gemmatimonadales bacterium]|nr:hypothetical protein [Gemmatimonadales bacterium]
MAPTLTTGKICSLEIPALDIQCSAAFYRRVFGWTIRKRGDGNLPATVDDVLRHAGFPLIGTDAPEGTARIKDFAGNVVGLYQSGR